LKLTLKRIIFREHILITRLWKVMSKRMKHQRWTTTPSFILLISSVAFHPVS